MRLLLSLLAAILLRPTQAAAHDDPVVTVRVMCDGFNTLAMDQVLGEISDSATVHFDGTVEGGQQIQAWVQKQMDDDLRIEIVDIGTPQKLPDGYTLSWTGRFSRQDWRTSGVDSREASNMVVIHNGRITDWTATLDSGVLAPNPSLPDSASTSSSTGGMPNLLGIPATLWLAGVVAVTGATVVVRGALHR